MNNLSYKILKYIGWICVSPAFFLIYLIGLLIGLIIGSIIFIICIISYMVLLFLFLLECIKGDVA